jgi:hypothetical protein
MKAPLSEPGWEVLLGRDAARQWGDKDRAVHQIWKAGRGEWCQPAIGTDFALDAWYRRPAPVPTVMEHFI